MTSTRRIGVLSFCLVALALGVLLAWWLTSRAGDESLAPGYVAGGAPVVASQPPPDVARSSTGSGLPASAPVPLAPADPAAAATASASTATPGALVVQVRWKADGSPAADIGLRLLELDRRDALFHPILGRTGNDGRWTLEGRPPGRVVVFSDRIEAGSGQIVGGQRTELTIELLPGVLVRGTVVDAGQRPVGGAELWLDGSNEPGAIATVGRADNVGRFVVRDVRRGQSLGASAPGHTRAWSARIDPDTPDPFDITLELGEPGGRVQGVVSDPDGRPVAEATVLVGGEAGFLGGKLAPLQDHRPPPPVRLLTDERGVFAADDVPAGKVPVAVRATGWSPWSGVIAVEVGKTTDLPIALQPSASVTGVVRDTAGEPMVDVHVAVQDRGLMGLQYDFTDGEGRFTLSDLPLGESELIAHRDGSGRATTVLGTEAGGRYVWDPVLGTGLLIRGRVIDASGAPLGGWRVLAIAHSGDQSSTKTDADGRFVIDHCADGLYRLDVDAGASAGDFAAATLSDVAPGPDEVEIVEADGAGTAFVVGRVVDVRGQALGVGRVFLTQSTTHRQVDVRTEGDSGKFRFGPLPGGRYTLEVEAVGLPGLSVPEFELGAGEVRDLGTLAFEKPGTLAVRVTTPQGVQVGLIAASAFRLNGGSGAMLERQMGGTLLSPALQPGDYRVRVWATHGAMQMLTTRVVAGVRTELEVALAACFSQLVTLSMPLREGPTPKIGAEIRNRNGVVVFEGQVNLNDQPDQHTRNGWVRACLPPADYSLQVRCDGQLVLDVPLLLAGATEDGLSEFTLP